MTCVTTRVGEDTEATALAREGWLEMIWIATCPGLVRVRRLGVVAPHVEVQADDQDRGEKRLADRRAVHAWMTMGVLLSAVDHERQLRSSMRRWQTTGAARRPATEKLVLLQPKRRTAEVSATLTWIFEADKNTRSWNQESRKYAAARGV